MRSSAREAFAAEAGKADEQINLLYAALLLAGHLSRAFDTSLYVNLVGEMVEIVRPAMSAAQTAIDRVGILNHYLFDELKFSGNAANYYHPHNSFLNKVLDLRRGIPISLSVIYLEIGWALGLPVSGIGLPGHFIVGYDVPENPLFIDVFNGGKLLTVEDCLELCQLPLSDLIPFKRDYLKPVSKKAILYRMLLNLKQIYVALEDWETSYKTVDLMLQIYPDRANEVRDRGLIAYRLGRLHAAIADVQEYLVLAPDNPDASWLEQHLEMMELKLGRLN